MDNSEHKMPFVNALPRGETISRYDLPWRTMNLRVEETEKVYAEHLDIQSKPKKKEKKKDRELPPIYYLFVESEVGISARQKKQLKAV